MLGLKLGIFAAALAIVYFTGVGRGSSNVQRKWDAERDAQALVAARERLRQMEANHGIGIDYRKQALAAAATAAAALSDADRLRADLARLAAPTAAGACPDATAAAAESLGECVGEYQSVAAAADRAVSQVAGLQRYVSAVCAPAPAD